MGVLRIARDALIIRRSFRRASRIVVRAGRGRSSINENLCSHRIAGGAHDGDEIIAVRPRGKTSTPSAICKHSLSLHAPPATLPPSQQPGQCVTLLWVRGVLAIFRDHVADNCHIFGHGSTHICVDSRPRDGGCDGWAAVGFEWRRRLGGGKITRGIVNPRHCNSGRLVRRTAAGGKCLALLVANVPCSEA